MDLLPRIDSWGRTDPNRVAHVSSDRTLTYGELAHAAAGVAAFVESRLPDDRSPVAVVGHKEPELLAAFLGAVKAGHPYVPIDVATPPGRIDRIVSTAGARLVLTPEVVTDLRGDPAGSSSVRIRPDDPFYIIFTSGSTGEPKGVAITLGSLTGFVRWMLEEQGFAERAETFLNQAPFSFDLSIMDLFSSLATGGTLFSLTADQVADPRRMYRALATSGITTWVSTPTFVQLCLAEPTFRASMLPRLRRFLFCGEILPPAVVAQLLDRFPDAAVWNTYGPTEATVATTSVRVDRAMLARYASLPVGFPRPDSRIFILGEAGQPLRHGERGEIVIAGPNVSVGYVGRPDLNARAFLKIDGRRAYRTGDWGTIQDGMLFFDGRDDSQIKLHGYRIELGDIEANVRALSGALDAMVLPVRKDGVVESLTACIVVSERARTEGPRLVRRLRAELAQQLPTYMLPRKWIVVDAFPMTPNGKADRRALSDLLQTTSESSVTPSEAT